LGRRRQAREGALHALYLADLVPALAPKAFSLMAPLEGADEKTVEFSRSLFEGTLMLRAEIDESLQAVAKNWTIARMAAADRNILRLAAYELLYRDDAPFSVVIDEAIEIARKYSTEDSTSFINGVLDKIKDLKKK
jgi:transcription antitermination protein NusB